VFLLAKILFLFFVCQESHLECEHLNVNYYFPKVQYLFCNLNTFLLVFILYRTTIFAFGCKHQYMFAASSLHSVFFSCQLEQWVVEYSSVFDEPKFIPPAPKNGGKACTLTSQLRRCHVVYQEALAYSG
jgi:hypothetical protein